MFIILKNAIYEILIECIKIFRGAESIQNILIAIYIQTLIIYPIKSIEKIEVLYIFILIESTIQKKNLKRVKDINDGNFRRNSNIRGE
jgi:hypothetical protein